MMQAKGASSYHWSFWVCSVLVVALFLTIAASLPPGSDILWRFHIAELILSGKTLYRDVIEVNPPLWFWGALPAVGVSSLTGLSTYSLHVGLNLAVTLLGVWLLGRVLQSSVSAGERQVAQLGLLAGLLLVPIAEIGQREQAFLLACALWSGLAVVRLKGERLGPWLCILVAIIAAYGFALKHYFVLVPLAIELVLLLSLPARWRPFRPETLVLGSLALLYAVAVLTLTPDFFSRVVPLVTVAYDGFGPLSRGDNSAGLTKLVMLVGFVFAAIVSILIAAEKRALAWLLALCAVIATGIVMLQAKGWAYHMIAAIGLAIIVMLLSVQSAFARKKKLRAWSSAVFALLATATGIYLLPATKPLLTGGQTFSRDLAPLLKTVSPRATVAILSVAPENSFLAPTRAGHPFWSRHFSFWMMPSLLRPRADTADDSRRLKELALIRQDFIHDLQCAAPTAIFNKPSYYWTPEAKIFDPIAFLSTDVAFARWLSAHYNADKGTPQTQVWRLNPANPPPKSCPKPPSP